MTPPDPNKCAKLASTIREYATHRQPSYLLLDEELGEVLVALEFCARKPGLYLAADDRERIEANEHPANLPGPGDEFTYFACYRIEEI